MSVASGETQEDLIKHGVDLRLAGDDEGALHDFEKAVELGRTPKAVAQLGLAEQALGRWVDADVHLSEALRSKSDPWVTKNRKTLEDALTVIKQHVARVEVLAEPAGAEIWVNGRKVGNAPLSSAVRVSSGEVAVEARAEGFMTGSHTVQLVGGQYQSVVLRLQKMPVSEGTKQGEGGSGDTHEEPAEDGPSSGRVIAKWTALGLGGAGLVTGVAATLVHNSRVSDFDNAENMNCAVKGSTAVHRDSGTAAPECQSLLDGYRRAQVWQIAGFATAGVFTAVWAILALTEPEPTAASVKATGSASRRRWACLPALGAAQLSCALTF